MVPYYITNEADECPDWATVKGSGEVVGCHDSEESATRQMVALSIVEGIEPGGEWEPRS